MTDRAETGSVGARLKALRESKRVTLRQIANVTRIAASALDAIERDDVKKLPGGIFGRSFVRAYARELGLDVEQTVAEFFGQFPDVHDGLPVTAINHQDNGGAEWQVPAGAVRGAMLAIPALALLAWMVFGSWTSKSQTPLSAERISAARPEVPAPVPTRSVPDVIPAGGALPAPAGATPGGSALTLHLTARAECWVSITADGREVVSRLMGVGEEEAVRAVSELRIKVGDASAVGLRLNGAAVRPLGRAGQVVTLRVDSTNVGELLETH